MMLKVSGGPFAEPSGDLLSCSVLFWGLDCPSRVVVLCGERSPQRRGGAKSIEINHGRPQRTDHRTFRTPTAFHIVRGWEIPIPQPFEALGFHVTKFMVVELIVALLMIAVFVPLARRLRNGDAPRGRLANFFEAMLAVHPR